MRNDNFKREFVKFFTLEFEEESLSDILYEKNLYMTEGSTCFCYKVIDGKIFKTIEVRMQSSHEKVKSDFKYPIGMQRCRFSEFKAFL